MIISLDLDHDLNLVSRLKLAKKKYINLIFLSLILVTEEA